MRSARTRERGNRYNDAARFKMMPLRFWTQATANVGGYAALSALYDEHLVDAEKAQFGFLPGEKAGRGRRCVVSAELQPLAVRDVAGRKAILALIDEKLAAPEYVDEAKAR